MVGRIKILVACLLPLVVANSHAQSVAGATATTGNSNSNSNSNDEALKAWQAASGGQVTPAVVKDSEGKSTLEWHNTLSADIYNNDIKLPPAPDGAPNYATPLNTGTFNKAVYATDIRLIEPGGAINYLQFGVTASNDRTLLSRYRDQLNGLQFGRTGLGYQYSGGDAAIGYSSLGSTLGLRGINLQQQINDWILSGFGGVVAESWEALYNRKTLDGNSARSQFLRNVAGAKIEKSISPGLKSFITAQGYSDNILSLHGATVYRQPSQARSYSTGFAYQKEAWTANAEIATSRYNERYQDQRDGKAAMLDSNYREATWGARAGYHDISPNYVSLSQSVPPGVKEWYGGLDWTTASWLTLGMDYRDASNRTAALTLHNPPPADPLDFIFPDPAPIAATSSNTKSLASRANINFGADLPGWSLSLNHTQNLLRDQQQQASRNQNANSALSYSSPSWVANVGYNLGKVHSIANPQYDSASSGLQGQLGRNYNSSSAIQWSIGWSLNAAAQEQKQSFNNSKTKTISEGLSINGQRQDWGQLVLQYQTATTSQTVAGPDLTTKSLQIDATKPFGQQNSVKAYLRITQRNIGQVSLRTDEKAAGMQLNMSW